MTTRPPLDPQTTDRLVSGRLAPDDAPPGYRQMAQLFSDAQPAARQPVPPAQLDAMVEVILTTADPSGRPASPRKPMLTKLLTAKALAVVGVLTLGVTAAGAATGSLPNAAQGVAHDTLAHIGVNLPDPDDAATPAVTDGQDDNNQQDTPVADTSGDNQGDDNNQDNGPVADAPGDNQGDNNSQDNGPVADAPGDNEGENNQQDTPVADTSGDNEGDNNNQDSGPVADAPGENQGDNNDDQHSSTDTTQPDDGQQSDSHGEGDN